MVDRTKNNSAIETLKDIYSHHSGCSFDDIYQKMLATRDGFEIKLLVVGHFNAGKSSLLNALIGRPDFLKEAQVPQTAIATELKYDECESAFAYKRGGKKEEMTEGKSYTPDAYDHLEYRLAVPELKTIEDYTIVDTPGFDAGIEAHTKALANYIGVGSAYLVVVDQEKGGIDQVTLDFIREISNYSNQIAVLINKCDKITDEVAESIADSARLTLAGYGMPYKVYTVSKRDPDIASKLVSVISQFDAQAAFDKVMKRHLRTELVNADKVLKVTQQKLFLDTFDLDTEISAYNRTEEQLKLSFEKQREEIKKNLDDEVELVVSRVRGALISRADSIAEAILSGSQVAAEAIIVETVRPIMLASMKDISMRQIDDITFSLDFTGLVTEEESVALSDVALNLADSLKSLIEQETFEGRNLEDFERNERRKNEYQAVTGLLAITTDFIAPWMEVVIILLPDIIPLLQGFFGESNFEQAKERFINNVVPQITNKIYPQIKNNIETSAKQVLDEYEKLINEKMEEIKNNIVEVERKKKEKIEGFEQYKKIIAEDIAAIHRMMEGLEEN